MELMVLGSGQDGGVPHTACYCDNCQRARGDPSFRRLAPSLAIMDKEKGNSYLIDASPELKQQLDMLPGFQEQKSEKQKFPLDEIFLTHAHFGHYAGLLQLGKEVTNTRELLVHCSPKMAAFLTQNQPFSFLVQDKNIKLHTLTPDQTYQFEGFSMTPFLVPHRNEAADTLAYLVEAEKKALYLPDLDRWTDELVKAVRKADLAILDGSFFSQQELPRFSQVPHPPILETMELFQDTKTTISFTHLNHSNPLNRKGKERQLLAEQGFLLAEDGLVLEL